MTYLTPEEICERYQIKKSKLYKMTSANIIPHFKLRNALRFDPQKTDKAFMREPKKINL